MQEVIFVPSHKNVELVPVLSKLVGAIKIAARAVLDVVRVVFEVLLTPPPAQRYIEENRLRMMRLHGHF